MKSSTEKIESTMNEWGSTSRLLHSRCLINTCHHEIYLAVTLRWHIWSLWSPVKASLSGTGVICNAWSKIFRGYKICFHVIVFRVTIIRIWFLNQAPYHTCCDSVQIIDCSSSNKYSELYQSTWLPRENAVHRKAKEKAQPFSFLPGLLRSSFCTSGIIAIKSLYIFIQPYKGIFVSKRGLLSQCLDHQG